ncbi:hypothetical protein EX30DRAFT_344033 [Ascodesmis nigricans]|uniref:Uncharacterized protein n=1 Tax=Ascodesmis nigricans TaxID=341454 RepID=A0A4S2MQB1_9PEZI|nr:hypothetical protein EX30DRAFT_344033 [Ascodesmis nigricans]
MSNPTPSTAYDTLPLPLLFPTIPITSTHLLSGGTTNSVHRCHTSTGSSVIAKRFWTFSVSSGPGAFELSLKRSEVENLVLENIPAILHPTVSAPTPLKFLHLRGNDIVETPNLADSTLLLSSDAGASTTTLKQLLTASSLSPSDSAALSPETWPQLGRALGQWLARFHWHFRLPAASSTATNTGELDEVRKLHHDLTGIGAGNFELWYTVTYGRLSSSYGEWEQGVVEKLQEIITAAEAPSADAANTSARTLVMGDFWTGNVLVSTKTANNNKSASTETKPTALTPEMTVIDWELSRTGHAWQDLGQMTAELLLCHYFGPEPSTTPSPALKVLTAFLTSYSREWDTLGSGKVFHVEKQSQEENRNQVDTELLALIHAMVHCVVWPEFSGWAPVEKVLQLKRDAVEVLTAVVRGTVGGVAEGLRGFGVVWEE